MKPLQQFFLFGWYFLFPAICVSIKSCLDTFLVNLLKRSFASYHLCRRWRSEFVVQFLFIHANETSSAVFVSSICFFLVLFKLKCWILFTLDLIGCIFYSFFSVSVQCLKTPSEALNPQSQADMVTRVFWIAVSLLESDYEHEFLMAIHLLNKVGLRKITKSATDCRTFVSPGVENRLRFTCS